MDEEDLNSVQRLVSRIEADILGWQAMPGTLLGTESELCDRYDVGRATFRQAARVLEASNRAVSRPGIGGGLVVCGDALGGAAKDISTYLEFCGAGLEEMLVLSAPLYQLAVRTASERLTLERADELRRLCADIQKAPLGFQRGMRLLNVMRATVSAGENPLITLMMQVGWYFYTGAFSFEGMTGAQFQIAEEQARELVEAVIRFDREGLAELTARWTRMNRRHLELSATLEDNNAEGVHSRSEGLSRTLSEQVAHRIQREVRRLKWPVGQRLGSEPQLMSRYQVSRATLRQALRQLEQCSVVRSRRGPGGGIFITAPDPDRVYASAVSALRSARFDCHHSALVIPDLVHLTFDLATSGEDRRRGLVRALEESRDIAGDDSARALWQTTNTLSNLSGNVVLSFLLNLLLRMEADALPSRSAAPPKNVRWLLTQAVQALSAGDDPRARRALLHLATRHGLSGLSPAPG